MKTLIVIAAVLGLLLAPPLLAQKPFLIQSYGYAVNHDGANGFTMFGGFGYPITEKTFAVAKGDLSTGQDGVLDFGADAIVGYAIKEKFSLLLLGGWRQNQVDTVDVSTSTAYYKQGVGFAYFLSGSPAKAAATASGTTSAVDYEMPIAITGMLDYTPGKEDWSIRITLTFAAWL